MSDHPDVREAVARIEYVTQLDRVDAIVDDHADTTIESEQEDATISPDTTSESAQDQQPHLLTERDVQSDPNTRAATQESLESNSQAGDKVESFPKLESVEHEESTRPSSVPNQGNDSVTRVYSDVTIDEPKIYDPTPIIRGYVSLEVDKIEVEGMSSHITTVLDDRTSPEHLTDSAMSAPTSTPPRWPVHDSGHDKLGLQEQESMRMIASNGHQVTVSNNVSLGNEQKNCSEDNNSFPQDPFARKVRETWSLMFGSRYEDDAYGEGSSPAPISNQHPLLEKTSDPVTRNCSTLRRKLNNRRQLADKLGVETGLCFPTKLDSTRESTVSAETTHTRSGQRDRWHEDDRPFARAGFNPTVVRFCIEKAMNVTIETMTKLRAIAQDEPEPSRSDLERGLFLTQWELDTLLNDLFPTAAQSIDLSTARLILDNAEYATIPFTTILQVSWFLPFDQLTSIRSLVAQISRKHLTERKLTILNASLRRHFILRPYPGTRLQLILLRVIQILVEKTNSVSKEDMLRNNQADERSSINTSDSHVIEEFLRAIHIRPPKKSCEVSIVEFLRLSPPDLALRFELTSIIAIQRIMFFRLLVEGLAGENAHGSRKNIKTWTPRNRATTHVDESDSPTVATAQSPASTRVTNRRRIKRSAAIEEVAESDKSDVITETPTLVGSAVATHGSASPQKEQLPEVAESSPTCDLGSEKLFGKMKETLNEVMMELVKSKPWLVGDTIVDYSPAQAATRASFVAAEAFQQSLSLLSSSQSSVPPSLIARIRDFTSTIHELVTQKEDEVNAEEDELPPAYEIKPQTASTSPLRPIPLAVQRSDTASTIFPPPYIPTGPAYWTFNPDLPPPTTPNTKLESAPRSILKAKSSPGVGDYDIRRGDKLTFQQKPSYSFSKSGLEPVDEGESKNKQLTTPKKSVQRKESTESITKEYTRWASAALEEKAESPLKKTKATTSRMFTEDYNHEEETIEQQIHDALRLQRTFVIDDMVQNLLARPRPSSVSRGVSLRTNATPAPSKRPTPRSHSATAPSRVVTRVREATGRVSNTASNPANVRETRPPPPYEPPELKQPPKDYEPPADDAHLRWAARVSEFYKAKLKSAEPN